MSTQNTKHHEHDDDDWDKKSESDGEEVKNNDVLQAKSNKENPNKLKDLFDKSGPTTKKTQNNKPKGDYNKDYKNKKNYDKGAPKFYNNNKNNDNTNDKPLNNQSAQTAQTVKPKEPSKPEFTGSIKTSQVETTTATHKVKQTDVKETPKQEDIVKPEFKVKEGKLVNLNVNEDVSSYI
jgi:hypothetical protein